MGLRSPMLGWQWRVIWIHGQDASVEADINTMGPESCRQALDALQHLEQVPNARGWQRRWLLDLHSLSSSRG